MAVTNLERTHIIKLVVGLMNIVPAAHCLADAIAAYENNGRSLIALAQNLADTACFVARNPLSQTASEFAATLLTPFDLQHNAILLDSITLRFDAGEAKGRIAYELVAALDATTNAAFKNARDILNSKAAV